MSVTRPHPSLPGFSGSLLMPDDPGYDTAREGTGCRPALIALCRTLDDVSAVGRYAAHTRQRLVVVGHGDVRAESGVDGSIWCDVHAVVDTGATADEPGPQVPAMRTPVNQARRHEVR